MARKNPKVIRTSSSLNVQLTIDGNVSIKNMEELVENAIGFYVKDFNNFNPEAKISVSNIQASVMSITNEYQK